MDILTTARFEIESFDVVDKGCHPGEGVFGVPTVAEQVAPGESCADRSETQSCEGIVPGLDGVSETMLWSLHNRASETMRPDGVLVDPESVRIRSAIDYDFARRFGDPVGSLAARAAEIDRALRAWLKHHPDGCVVSLGEGLETQGHRVDNGRLRWLSVDLPDAIRLRERFLAPSHRFCHCAASVLDPVWMDAVDPQFDIFIVAQGLLMYLEPETVRRLFTNIADRFPTTEIVFDAVPRWFSRLTLWGLNQTPDYRLPAMPWGINRDELESTLRSWHPRVATVALLDYRAPRGLPRMLADMTNHIPVARHAVPSLVHVTMANAPSLPTMNANTLAGGTSPTSHHEEYGFENLTTIKEPQMTATNGNVSRADTTEGMLAMARQNASRGNDLAKATTKIIAKRVALGLAAVLDPMHADHVEFARMVPEKVRAFSAAGMVMLDQSGEASRKMMRLASEEVMTTASATIEMSCCSSPAAWAEAQSRFARAWFGRASSSLNMMGMLMLTAQAAVMVPIRQTVAANAERLGG
ncbi:class I SAM-dependent methyltransferase [Bradyrhizobium sp. LTSP885]|uniref:class I SAM-dependent methyltransferase n=1 Tax=Bradyrhizobium sp. LTSP885 TaxID=1619232 RepID=UPI0007C687BE|nr:class I SAM-dependent methyltransferase [Bradyrhizobium sp. LTSP885]